ncbi:MAG TPA: patatin-like phospholipase family protein [Thermoanaerobaculia bacterium]|nr:patatin-like phospholipase family protein [Thermoanaerobaculia bacterium]
MNQLDSSSMARKRLALVLAGGGARAAYQVGVLRGLVDRFPRLEIDIVTGVSAGAINAAFLASRAPDLRAAVDELQSLWRSLRPEHVFRVDSACLLRNLVGWGAGLISGGSALAPRMRGLVDTSPLRSLLERALPVRADGCIAGVEDNLSHCRPSALALTTLDYATGRTITWVGGCAIDTWDRPSRRAVRTRFTVDHVMASAALPLLFPAVELAGSWHGDGGIRLAAPLSPALHLGADQILAISTSYRRAFHEAEAPATHGYPPPAQVLGQLMSAIFLDVIDEDAARLQRSNDLLRELPPEQRRGYRPVDLCVMRPSVDPSEIAASFESRLPRGFRFVSRGLGTRETSRPDFLSLLMFQPDFVRELIRLGEEDVERRSLELATVLGLETAASSPRATALAGGGRMSPSPARSSAGDTDGSQQQASPSQQA